MSVKINSIKVVTEFVDESTGEVFTEERVLGEETKKEKKPRAAKKPKDNDPIAKIRLTDNKLEFNNAAVELTGFEPDSKVLIQFEKKGRVITPVMSLNEKGNRLTKTFTVSFRGQQRENLLEYGDVFEVIPYDNDMFKLQGNIEKEDDIIDVPEEVTDPEEFVDDLSIDDVDFDFD